MITYLTGASNPDLRAAAGDYENLGILGQPGNRLDRQAPTFGGRMAMDNGCFAKGDEFDLEGYLTHLRTVLAEGGRPMWATAPDVVGDYTATTIRSIPVMPRIRELGIPVAYVAQNGIENDLGRIRWDLFDALFLGGSPECLPCGFVRAATAFDVKTCPAGHKLTEWKVGPGAAAVTRAAKAHGKTVHMGRVNSLKRLRIAQAMGCDTADGTYLARAGRKGTATVLGWLRTLAAEAAELAAAA